MSVKAQACVERAIKRTDRTMEWSLRARREKLTAALGHSLAHTKTEKSLSWTTSFFGFKNHLLKIEFSFKRQMLSFPMIFPFGQNHTRSYHRSRDLPMLRLQKTENNLFKIKKSLELSDFDQMENSSRRPLAEKVLKINHDKVIFNRWGNFLQSAPEVHHQANTKILPSAQFSQGEKLLLHP